ncbi:Fanconi anemia group B protein [Diretmus argenteus]
MESTHRDVWLQPNLPRLSLCGRIISFHCSSAQRGSERSASELVFHSLSFQREHNAFRKARDGAVGVSRTRGCSVDLVTCQCAVDVRRRVRTPCVLVAQSKTRDMLKYSLFTMTSSDTLEPHVDFKLPYQMRGRVSILQGPTVLWGHAGGVFYTSLQAGEVKQIPTRFSHSLIGELPLDKGQVFILGVQTSEEHSSSTVRSHTLQQSSSTVRSQTLQQSSSTVSQGSVRGQTLGYLVESGQTFDGTLLLPHAYSCITQRIVVLSAEKVEGVLKSTVVAVTSQKQLVYFEDGVVKEACPLPFEGPGDIQVVNTGRNGCVFTVSFDQGHVCAVWKDTFEVASCWSGVSSVHVDDFLGCGTEQLLLVFVDQGTVGQPLDKFIITDLCGTTFSGGEENGALNTSRPPQENYLLTLHALESRLQSGLTMLQELQREVRVKERVLLQAVQALTDVVSEREPVLTQNEQEGLVALWDADDETKDAVLDDEMLNMPAVPSKPEVDKLWHRIVEDRLVVGVMLIDSSIPVDGLSLSIVTEMNQRSTPVVIQTQSQVFWLPAPGVSSPSPPSTLPGPAAKRCKQDNADKPNDANTCRLAVTAVTKLTPLLNSGCVKCLVMLHYVQRQECSAPVNDPTPVVLHCGQVPFDVQSNSQTQLLNNCKLKTDEVREDLLSLLAVLDRWVFHIDSPDHSMGDVDGWIQRTVGCERVEISPHYLLFNSSGPSGPSALMLLHWHQTTPFQGELSVHSSQLRMLQFLDSLLGFLPASCSVQPLKETGRQGTAQMFSLMLEREVLSLKEGVSSLLCGEVEEEEGGERRGSTGVRQPETPEPTSSVEGVRRCREKWDRDVERCRMRLSPLVDVGSYRRLSQRLATVQLQGDTAALLETQRTWSSSGLH